MVGVVITIMMVIVMAGRCDECYGCLVYDDISHDDHGDGSDGGGGDGS